MKKITVAGILCLFSLSVWAEGKDPEIEPDLHAYGAEIRVGFKPVTFIEGMDTILWTGVGAAYGFPSYYHDSLSGNAIAAGASDDKASVNQIWVQWLAGIAQGLIYNPEIKKNLLEVFLFYRGQFLKNSAGKDVGNYLLDSAAPDKEGLVQTTFLLGLSLNNVTKSNSHGLKTGNYQEISFEAGPKGLQSVGVDYLRFNGSSSLYYPLFDLDSSKADSSFSILFGNFSEIDYLWGDNIPVMIQQTFGGRNVRTGMGASVRGTEGGRFDGRLKMVNNLELRFNGPTLFLEALIPGIVTYFDAGYYSQVPGLADGVLFSTGYGIYINIMNLGNLALYQDYWLNGSRFSPKAVRFALGLHF